MSKYTEKDAAKDSGDSSDKVSSAWHQARDDSGARSGGDTKSFKNAPSWAKDDTKTGLFPSGKGAKSSGKSGK